MLKLTFVITGLSTGGAETMLLKLLSHIDRVEFQTQVISLTTKGNIGHRIEALGIPVLALDMQPNQIPWRSLLTLRKLLKEAKPDIVQTWMYHADLLGGLAAKSNGIKCIVWALRNSDLSADRNKFVTRKVVAICSILSRWIPDLVLSCSEQAMRAHANIGYAIDKLKVIPNGFDLKQFSPDADARASVRAELGLPDQAQLVGLIARFDPQKNHAGFLEAAGIVATRVPGVHFILAGEAIDSGNQWLCHEIQKSGISNRVHLLGRRDDMPRIMASLDVLASTSHGEAFPNVLGEAMACQVPCVVTDVGDCREIVGPTGRTVSAGDMQSFALQMCDLLMIPPAERQTLGKSARDRIKALYDIRIIAGLYQDQYLDLMEKR